MNRQDALGMLRARVAASQPVIGAGAGTGLSAKCAEAGGADLLTVFSSGRYRMAGRGSLACLMPYGDANAIVLEMAAEVLPVVRHTPVLAGVCGTDPFRQMPLFLTELKGLGFCGVQNHPTVGLIDGLFRANLEATGMGFGLEIAMIRQAHELDLLTCPFVFDPEQARLMAEAGADLVVAHAGLTVGGMVGARTARKLDETAELVRAIGGAASAVNPDILVLCHGGPMAAPGDVAAVLGQAPGIAGYFGGSSTERLPSELAITEAMRSFKAIRPARAG
ncbi:MAG: phosphoenolpyruvate hydrolase family protein [Streptosporangiaceae bacterium]